MANKEEATMLSANNLIYRMPESLSLATNRSMKRQYFLRRTYDNTAGVMQCTWNTGVDAVNLSNSYLYIKMRIDGAAGTFGATNGSVLNIIRNTKISHRSRTELSRTERNNIYQKFNITYNKSAQWVASHGPALGLNGNLADGVAQEFIVPLDLVDPVFSPLNKHQTMPASLASGLHCEFDLEGVATAINGAGVGSYTIENIYFNLDCVSLQDSANFVINKMASTSLLEWTFDRVFTAPEPFSSTVTTATVNKAVSSANRAFAAIFTTADLTAAASDSFATIPYIATRAQWRLGSEYYNNTAIENPMEGYWNALSVFNVHNKEPIVLTPATFAAAGSNVMAVSLERDQHMNRSSLPVNTSRMLELQATLSGAAVRTLVIFFEYTSIVRVSLQNVSVKI